MKIPRASPASTSRVQMIARRPSQLRGDPCVSAIVSEPEHWLLEPESGRIEFGEAKSNFHFETLAKYCAALADEGGGKIILGATDKRRGRLSAPLISRAWPNRCGACWSPRHSSHDCVDSPYQRSSTCLPFAAKACGCSDSLRVFTGRAAAMNCGHFLKIDFADLCRIRSGVLS